jgi:hypothetical protein
MRRNPTIIRTLVAVAAVVGGLVTFAPAAWATPVTCGEQALVDAIDLANSTSAKDTLNLASGCTYTMTSAHGSTVNGASALPLITTPIELIGPATITRSSLLGLSSYRIAEVSPTGKLTLTTSVAMTNGSAVGDGGGILNSGSVTLTKSSLTGNSATGNGGGLANVDTPAGTAPAATFTESAVSDNTAGLGGGGIYNGVRGSLTTSGVTGTPMFMERNSAAQRGGGIAAVSSTATTLTQTAVTTNHADVNSGGIYREGGTMIVNTSPITANTANNCVGSVPAVPTCTG